MEDDADQYLDFDFVLALTPSRRRVLKGKVVRRT